MEDYAGQGVVCVRPVGPGNEVQVLSVGEYNKYTIDRYMISLV